MTFTELCKKGVFSEDLEGGSEVLEVLVHVHAIHQNVVNVHQNEHI